MVIVTVALAPGAKVPLVAERLIQFCVFEAVQVIEAEPVFWSV
jgi:hypothetical protein